VIMGRHDNGSRPDGTIFALDPATGTMLMHPDVDNFEADDVVLGESTLVIGARRDGKTRGYDMATGRVQWTVPDPASRIVDGLAMQSAAGTPPESQRGGFGGPPVATSQFVQLTADGTAIVRDLATGAESARRAGAVIAATGDSRDQLLAVDGILYVIDRNKPWTSPDRPPRQTCTPRRTACRSARRCGAGRTGSASRNWGHRETNTSPRLTPPRGRSAGGRTAPSSGCRSSTARSC
jgi:hypothetical protein